MNGEMMIAGAIIVFAGIYEERLVGLWIFITGVVIMVGAIAGVIA